jgi:hypothetical protein
MSILTYDTAHVSPVSGTAPKRKGFWRGILDAMIESRMRQAELEITRHLHRLPRELEQAGWKVSERSEDSLPFVR